MNDNDVAGVARLQPHTRSPLNSGEFSYKTSWLPELPRSVWLSALAVGLVFFITEHNVGISLAQDYTQDADTMLAVAAGGNFFRRLAFLGIAALGLGLLIRSPARLASPTILGVLIATMTVLAFASVLWSHDLGLCLRRLFAFSLSLLGMIGLARACNLKELCYLALFVSLGCVFLGVASEIVLGTFRPWSSDYRFSGTVHPNTQGIYLATMCFAALCLSMDDAPRRKMYWAILAAGIVLLVLTKSRTSTAGTLAALGGVGLLMSTNRVRLLVLLGGTFAAASGLLILLLSGADADAILAKVAFLGRQEETESFSGRTTIWPVVQHFIDQRFWFGWGFESFWTPAAIEEVSLECEWAVRECHSSYREILLSFGIVGLAIYSAIAVIGMIAAGLEFRLRRDVCALFWVGMVANGLFNGMFESGMALVSFPTFMIAAGLARLAFFSTANSHVPAPAPSPPPVAIPPFAFGVSHEFA